MVHIYWDFGMLSEQGFKIPVSARKKFLDRLINEMKLTLGYVAGFDNPYIELRMIGDDIVYIAVRHLTYQTQQYREQIENIAYEEFARYKVRE